MLKVNFLCFVLIVFFQLSHAQFKLKSISPTVDQQDSFNIQIIKTLCEFLENQDPKFWLESDFKKFKSPYYEIIGIESEKLGDKFYQPSLMEIIPTDEDGKKL
ncbi:hypothetical protein OF897_11650 [Chryseobacterium formosus]|uniref:Uncharacterized protein n=1 Tax=Chryseobacterium formosus TaxID=1537363 RepID=A0ABT3XR17_9FLAO|nr:hypothetical protein [Chryseobacterium formosus]MCX8524568.1 hypothetical protein [Chryseobacterium formosus]